MEVLKYTLLKTRLQQRATAGGLTWPCALRHQGSSCLWGNTNSFVTLIALFLCKGKGVECNSR
jgi:hypothetical protein